MGCFIPCRKGITPDDVATVFAYAEMISGYSDCGPKHTDSAKSQA